MEEFTSEYLTAKDIQKIIPEIGYIKALEIIKDAQEEMQRLGYYVPHSKRKVALKKVVKERLGL